MNQTAPPPTTTTTDPLLPAPTFNREYHTVTYNNGINGATLVALILLVLIAGIAIGMWVSRIRGHVGRS